MLAIGLYEFVCIADNIRKGAGKQELGGDGCSYTHIPTSPAACCAPRGQGPHPRTRMRLPPSDHQGGGGAPPRLRQSVWCGPSLFRPSRRSQAHLFHKRAFAFRYLELNLTSSHVTI